MKSIKNIFFALVLGSFVLVSCGEQKQEPAAEAQNTEQAATTETTETVTATETTTEEAATEEKTEEVATARDYNAQPLMGYVASLDDLMMGGEGRVNSAKAKSLAEAGKVLVFVGEGKIYYVSDAGGNFARKGLVKIAGEKEFGLKGKAEAKYGLNYFIASNL